MSERSDLDYLRDILDGIDTIQQYTEEMTFDAFKNDPKTVDAVVRNFEVIGEAASNLSDTLKNRYTMVEWNGVVNFRNVMIHDYFRVDTAQVWDTIHNNLPLLKQQITTILEQETEDK